MSDLIAFFPSGEMVAFLAAMGFIAAFIDSVVGGGGLISVPTLLAAGLIRERKSYCDDSASFI